MYSLKYVVTILSNLLDDLSTKALGLLNKYSFMKDSWGINTDINICFANYEIIKIHVIKTSRWYTLMVYFGATSPRQKIEIELLQKEL